MGWFDILKLGGEDFGTPPEKDAESYDDRLTDKKEDFFHNLKDVATTRPHFEYSAKKKYPDNIQGNLREIAQALKGKIPKNNVEYIAFSDRTNSNFVVSFRLIGLEDDYTGSIRPSRFKKPTRPKDLGNTKPMILFDSVYSTHDVDRLRQVFGSPLERLISIWEDDDKYRLREIMQTKGQVNLQELFKKRAELTAKQRELIAEKEKLEKKNRNPKMPYDQREKNKARIYEINIRVEEIKNEVKKIDNYSRRSKGRTGDRRRRRRR